MTYLRITEFYQKTRMLMVKSVGQAVSPYKMKIATICWGGLDRIYEEKQGRLELSVHLWQDATDCKRIHDTGLSSEEQTWERTIWLFIQFHLNPWHFPVTLDLVRFCYCTRICIHTCMYDLWKSIDKNAQDVKFFSENRRRNSKRSETLTCSR